MTHISKRRPKKEFFNDLLGATADSAITQHYISPNISVHLAEKTMVKFGGAIGLTNTSQDIFRIAVGYEF